jgi:tRNA threonylcarbamoyladenosine biosynthesis protein TsaE
MTHEGGLFTAVEITDLSTVARYIVNQMDDCRVWLFHGEMGSGKTTLIKEICTSLGVTDVMSSPTFSIVNEYHTSHSGVVYHFDFYRIKNEAEALDIGTEEYFYSGKPCMVEWPEKIPGLTPEVHADVTIQLESSTKRTIAIAVHDGKKENRL